MDLDKMTRSLHVLERKILPFLHDHATLSEISIRSKLNEDEVSHALKWLQNKGLINLKTVSTEIIALDKNALYYLKNALPERKLINLLKEKSLSLKKVKHHYRDRKEDISPAIGSLKQKHLISLESKGKEIIVKLTERGLKFIQNKLPEEILLKQLSERIHRIEDIKIFDKDVFDTLKRRKGFIRLEHEKSKSVVLTNTCKQLLEQKIDMNLIESLTPEIIKNKEWQKNAFRRYDVESIVPSINGGKKHFVNESISYIRRIWLDLGFKEMNGPLIQPSFWNFDALFVPQDHPARELQDTLFVEGFGKLPNRELVKKIKEAHENGSNTGSKGWGYNWEENKSMELVLRTHTTTLSALTLASLNKDQIPCKYFAVGKCFRNETIDWKHGFEFTQVEGIVVDENATFSHLLGYLKEYYHKLGFDEIRFRPSYFPYTEPSVEVEVYNRKRKEWVELGGAGIFRQEVVKPLLGRDIPVLAWGQGMERSIMDYYKINDFRELYKNDLKFLREVKPWLK